MNMMLKFLVMLTALISSNAIATQISPHRIAFVLQKNEFFSTDWENFKVPRDMHLYLITQSNNNKIDPKNTNFFDVIQIEEFSKPVIEKVIKNILRENHVSEKYALIITHDEYAIDIAAELRHQFKIYGSKPNQVKPFRNKVYAKSKLAGRGVNIPKYVSYNPNEFKRSPDKYISCIEKKLGYPMFAKPLDEARCADVSRINSKKELYEWAKIHNTHNFEIEEFIDGELYTSICIIKDNTIVHHGAHKFLYPCFEFMNSKKPLGGVTLQNDHEDVKALLLASQKVFQTFPIEDCVTHIEFMKDKFGNFIFIEAAARQPGGYISDIYYKKSDIHLGKTNFMLQLGLQVDLKENNQYCAGWFWPHKPYGQVTSVQLPKIKSKFKYEWRVSKNENFNGSEFLGDSSIRLILWSSDFEELTQDMHYLENSYKPTL